MSAVLHKYYKYINTEDRIHIWCGCARIHFACVKIVKNKIKKILMFQKDCLTLICAVLHIMVGAQDPNKCYFLPHTCHWETNININFWLKSVSITKTRRMMEVWCLLYECTQFIADTKWGCLALTECRSSLTCIFMLKLCVCFWGIFFDEIWFIDAVSGMFWLCHSHWLEELLSQFRGIKVRPSPGLLLQYSIIVKPMTFRHCLLKFR